MIRHLLTAALLGAVVFFSGCATSGSEWLYRMDYLKVQERLTERQITAMEKAAELLDKIDRDSQAIAEIETDETGRSHVKVYPQGEKRMMLETVRELILSTQKRVGELTITPPEKSPDWKPEAIRQGHDLAKTGIMGWIARELLGIFVHGPNWQWAGDGMVD